jgi:hypothetical protein
MAKRSLATAWKPCRSSRRNANAICVDARRNKLTALEIFGESRASKNGAAAARVIYPRPRFIAISRKIEPGSGDPAAVFLFVIRDAISQTDPRPIAGQAVMGRTMGTSASYPQRPIRSLIILHFRIDV